MKTDKSRAADVFRIVCSAVLTAVLFSTLFLARPTSVGAAGSAPGAGIGVAYGGPGEDGMIEGSRNRAASDIGESISRGIEEIKDEAGSLADGMFGGVGTEGTGRGPDETDPGFVREPAADGAVNGERINAAKEPADTIWVVAAVVAAVAVVAAIAVAIPKKPQKNEEE